MDGEKVGWKGQKLHCGHDANDASIELPCAQFDVVGCQDNLLLEVEDDSALIMNFCLASTVTIRIYPPLMQQEHL